MSEDSYVLRHHTLLPNNKKSLMYQGFPGFHMERVMGIEPTLPAWKADRGPPLFYAQFRQALLLLHSWNWILGSLLLHFSAFC